MQEEQQMQENPVNLTKEGASADKYEISMEAMLKAGVHFGHKKARWNPKMKSYIFGVRNGIHIIDLEKTEEMLSNALDFVEKVLEKSGSILIVGTKKQAKDLVRAVADKIEMPYVEQRWLGGTFTNFSNITKRVKYLVDTKDLLEKGKLSNLTKLERLKIQKEMARMEERMGGLVRMTRLPDAIFVLDTKKDDLAIREAKNVGVKVIGLADSNSDPSILDYAIPANDDALSSIRYIMGVFLKKVLEAKSQVQKTPEKNQIKK